MGKKYSMSELEYCYVPDFICNFSCNERTFPLPEAFAKASDLVKIIGNYCDCAIEQNMRIRAYEAIVLQCNASASDE